MSHPTAIPTPNATPSLAHRLGAARLLLDLGHPAVAASVIGDVQAALNGRPVPPVPGGRAVDVRRPSGDRGELSPAACVAVFAACVVVFLGWLVGMVVFLAAPADAATAPAPVRVHAPAGVVLSPQVSGFPVTVTGARPVQGRRVVECWSLHPSLDRPLLVGSAVTRAAAVRVRVEGSMLAPWGPVEVRCYGDGGSDAVTVHVRRQSHVAATVVTSVRSQMSSVRARVTHHDPATGSRAPSKRSPVRVLALDERGWVTAGTGVTDASGRVAVTVAADERPLRVVRLTGATVGAAASPVVFR